MMKSFSRKQLIIIVSFCVTVLAGAAVFSLFYFQNAKKTIAPKKTVPAAEKPAKPAKPETQIKEPVRETLGLSVQGRQIESYVFGNGKDRLIFVGGIHGGYEWNSVLLAYRFIDYFGQNPNAVPQNLSVIIIPSLNPDGVFKITGKDGRFTAADIPSGSNGAGRLNANGVDLNRNFDCNWRPDAVWQGNKVSGGSAAFSEPESAAIRDYVLKNNPAAVIFWHSQSNAIYGSQCNSNMLPETSAIMKAYSAASGYPAAETFTQYQVSGDVTDWLASVGIPAMTVELKTHETIEWEQNLAGIKALFKYFEKK